MDQKIIKKTQDSLGKIVKKPPLTEKLLGKPPFRFLHDVFTAVTKSTGFMKGLFSDAESSSENVKDKDSKIAYLQKAIDMVALVLGKTVAAKPSKIVAGHEPEKTNEFLQWLADAANKKINNEDYVQRVLKGDSAAKKEKPRDKERDRSSDGRRKKERDGEKEEKEKERERRHKSRDKDKDRKERKEGEDDRKDRHRDKDRRKRRDEDGDEKDRSRDKERDKDKEKDRERRRKEKEEEKAEEPVTNGEKEKEEEAPAAPSRPPRPSSAKGARRRHGQDEEESRPSKAPTEDDVPPQVSAARKLARPSSARPAPPRVKKNEPLHEEPAIMGQSNVPNIITDKTAESDSDDDDAFMTKDDDLPPADDGPPAAPPGQDQDDADHGGLVKKMLKTKEDLEGGSQTVQAKKTEIDRSSAMSDATRRKEREMVQKEIDRLRGSIQSLTRSVHPLGKIMDFVQEDLDSMHKELDVWKAENKQNAVALQREQSITAGCVEPLRAQLSEVDSAISDQLDLIAALKANILRNDDRIEKMLATVTKS